MVMNALALPWSEEGLFSPVKKNNINRRSPTIHKFLVFLGRAPENSPKRVINPQIQRIVDSMDIKVVHVGDEKFFDTISFINSNVPFVTVSSNIRRKTTLQVVK
jgi:hypothetical protein